MSSGEAADAAVAKLAAAVEARRQVRMNGGGRGDGLRREA
jgi:hypothetical protein